MRRRSSVFGGRPDTFDSQSTQASGHQPLHFVTGPIAQQRGAQGCKHRYPSGAGVGFARQHQRQLTALPAHQVEYLYASVNGDHVGRYVIRLGNSRALELCRQVVKMLVVAPITRAYGEQIPQSRGVYCSDDYGDISHRGHLSQRRQMPRIDFMVRHAASSSAVMLAWNMA